MTSVATLWTNWGALLVVIAVNAALVPVSMRLNQRRLAAVNATIAVLGAGALVLNTNNIAQRAVLDELRKITAAECDHAPAVVPYHEGMTLCPGQSTTIEIPMPRPGKDL